MPTSERKPRKKKRGIARTDPEQSATFIKSAKELGLGEGSGEAFERAIDSLTKPKIKEPKGKMSS
jgi:hypothetical protein